ncbi:MAG: RluA family pseudouridine synthase [Pyrinomonadaceae bacterium]|nr:RluA family pseudouridine synthase [Pyrinomonadaceae bacterium]MCX7640547.1 RluA family pseudouridine synthase [Pyrinomonadaceae bacterium]MDW8303872.1 RluA family pseudouridine synthase [Acidobacteriota bacterium]
MQQGVDENFLSFVISEEDVDKRLDVFLAEKIINWSRSRLKRLINEGDVLVNEETSKPAYKLRKGDVIEVELSEIPTACFQPENIPIELVYEDEFLAVIDKPSGMVVHPGAGISSGTLANAIAWHFGLKANLEKTPEEACRVGIVHRLDKETSGLLVVAKSDEIQQKLSEQFQNREVEKKYIALVHGVIEQECGKIEAPIGRDRKIRTKMRISENGRYALSFWRVIRRYQNFTLVEVEIKTGRTHQIRVHLAHIGHPIVGDKLYNSGRDKTLPQTEIKKAIFELKRFFLHSHFLAFKHPVRGQKLAFSSKLPKELNDFLKILEKSSKFS